MLATMIAGLLNDKPVGNIMYLISSSNNSLINFTQFITSTDSEIILKIRDF